jgi:hypothetical protein
LYYIYGLEKRKIFATVKNRESSRSHTVFQIKLYKRAIETKNNKTKNRKKYLNSKIDSLVCLSKFTLVDLAGSERLSDAEKTIDRIEEAKYINKSLSALGNVIYHLKN